MVASKTAATVRTTAAAPTTSVTSAPATMLSECRNRYESKTSESSKCDHCI